MKIFFFSFLVLMGSGLTSFQAGAQSISASPNRQAVVDQTLPKYTGYTQSIPAPPCRQVDLSIDTTRKRILDNFISASDRERYFVNDKGIIHLTTYTDAKGLTNWKLSPQIDDWYKYNPTPTFAVYDDYIILVYPADVNGNELRTPETAPVNKCLEDIIGDRVYLRPTRRDRWVPPYKEPGLDRVFTQGRRVAVTGGGGEIHVLFYKNGTYKITPMH